MTTIKIETDLVSNKIVNKEMTTTPQFNWTLDRKKFTSTIFLKQKMTEVLDINQLYSFIRNNMGISYSTPKGNMYHTEIEHLKKFKELFNKSLQKFHTSHQLPKHKWGRVIPLAYLSLCVLHRPTRHTFANNYYVDIDMENAHPTIIYNIAKSNGIQLNVLKKYIDNPKYYRALIKDHHDCDKDIAKELPIILMFGGSYDTWIRENNITENDENKLEDFENLETEIRGIIEIVYTNNPNIKKDVLKQTPNKWSNEDESKRGVMGIWCQTIERYVQEHVISWLIQNKNFKVEDIIPSQDGFMILKENFYENIITDINRIVLEKTHLPIKFVVKPFDEKFEIPKCENEKTCDEWLDDISVKKLEKKFLSLYNNYVIRYNDNLYVYYGDMDSNFQITNGRWYDETNEKKRFKLMKYLSENLYNHISKEIKDSVGMTEDDQILLLKILREHTSRTCYTKDIIAHILSNAKVADKDFNSNPFLLGFNNGVYDLKNGLFRPYRYDDYITMTTRYDYKEVDYNDEETIKMNTELANMLLNIQPNEEHLNLLLIALASGLDGRAYQKIFMYNGQGGNGKGLLGALMDIILGDYYHQPSNGILKDVEKANTPSPDMINLKNKRYINFKEVSGKIKVAMLRNLTGGGKFSGRYLNQNPEQFYMSGTFVMEFNTDPELDGQPQRADYRRMVNIFFPTNFTDDETKIGRTVGPITYRKANTYYETNEFLEKAKYLFLDLLINVYKENVDKETDKGLNIVLPQSIRDRTEKFIENQNVFHKIFHRYYEIKNVKPQKPTPVKEIWEFVKTCEDYVSLSFADKKIYGRDNFHKYLEGLFTIGGNTKTGKIIIDVEIIRKEITNDIDDDKKDDDEDLDNEFSDEED